MSIHKCLKISISAIFTFSLLVFSFPAFAQVKVLQCAPGRATVNNNLRVNGDLTVNNNATVSNNATVTNDLSVINGNLYLGPNGAKPYITDNAGFGILFYSQGGDNFLWQSGSGNPGAAAMVLGAVLGLPVGDNGFNLQVHGQVSSYQLHTLGIHLDMQSGIGPTPKQNILKITNSNNTGTGYGAAIFHGANNWQANTDDNLIFSGLTNAQDIGTIGLTINTVSGNVGIRTVNPQITLAVGDNDTGFKWISDGNFQLVSNGNYEIDITPGNVSIRNNLCLGGSCISSWPSSPTITLTGDVTGSGITSIATTIPSGTIAWGELSGIPADISDGDQVGITSVPNCGANQKLTGSAGSPVCANDIDTDTNTDAQTLSITGDVISLTNGGTITLPAGASGDITSVIAGTNLTGGGASGDVTLNVANSPTFSGDLIVQGNTTLGDASTDTTTVNGSFVINKSCNGGFIRIGNTCMASGINGNDGRILIRSVTNTGNADYTAAAANFATLDILDLNGTSAKFAIVRALCGEARIYVRKVGSTAGAYWTDSGSYHPEQTILCSAGNDSHDWSNYGKLYYIDLDSNRDIQWSLDARDPPTMLAELYLVGYVE